MRRVGASFAVGQRKRGKPVVQASALAEIDPVSELQAASDAPAPRAADERAALEMQEMQAAIDAERAERAERAAGQLLAPDAGAVPARRPEPLCLVVRTSLLCEFRDSGGHLQAFEVCSQASFGSLCAALSHMPGLVFPDQPARAWFRRPSRFSFREQVYEVDVPYGNIRVAPVNQGEAVPEMEELLEYVRLNVLKGSKSAYITTARDL
jgi:hypothetical protein